MATPSDRSPAGRPDSSSAGRAAASPGATASDLAPPGAGPLPSPADAPAGGAPRPSAPLILQTTLFGPLSVPDGAALAAELEELSRRAAVYATRARGDGTRRTYRSAWRHYEAWCARLGREPLAGDPRAPTRPSQTGIKRLRVRLP